MLPTHFKDQKQDGNEGKQHKAMPLSDYENALPLKNCMNNENNHAGDLLSSSKDDEH